MIEHLITPKLLEYFQCNWVSKTHNMVNSLQDSSHVTWNGRPKLVSKSEWLRGKEALPGVQRSVSSNPLSLFSGLSWKSKLWQPQACVLREHCSSKSLTIPFRRHFTRSWGLNTGKSVWAWKLRGWGDSAGVQRVVSLNHAGLFLVSLEIKALTNTVQMVLPK